MFTVYILRCELDKYYVGKTSMDMSIRFQRHLDEKPITSWLVYYKPLEIIETCITDDLHKENTITKNYMIKYGIENVRNSDSYSDVILADWQIKALKHEFNVTKLYCDICDAIDHFTNDCTLEIIYEDQFKTLDEINEEIDLINRAKDKHYKLTKIIDTTSSAQIYKTQHIIMTLQSILALLKSHKNLKPSKSVDIKPFLDEHYQIILFQIH